MDVGQLLTMPLPRKQRHPPYMNLFDHVERRRYRNMTAFVIRCYEENATKAPVSIMWEETFGLVIPITHVKGVDEARELANKSRYGLDSCLFTNHINLGRKVAKRLEEAEVTINEAPRHGVGYYPFGGNKDSGMGREGIGYSIEEMTRFKTIVYNRKPAKVWADLFKERT